LFNSRLGGGMRAAAAAGLEPGLLPDAQPRDPIETARIEAPLRTPIARCRFEAGRPAGRPLAGQGWPRFIAHLGWPPQPGGPWSQRLKSAGEVHRPPALQLPFTIPQQGGGAPQTAAGAGCEPAQQLDPIGDRPATALPLRGASGRRALNTRVAGVDPQEALRCDADGGGELTAHSLTLAERHY
jgi:hypothetical protein